MRMRGFSQTEIFYVNSDDPNGPVHKHDSSIRRPR